MTSSDGTGMMDDSIAMRTNISRYERFPKKWRSESISECIKVRLRLRVETKTRE